MKARLTLWLAILLGASLFAGCTLMDPQGRDGIKTVLQEPGQEKKAGDAGSDATPDASEPVVEKKDEPSTPDMSGTEPGTPDAAPDAAPDVTPDSNKPDNGTPDTGSGDELKPPAGTPAKQAEWYAQEITRGFCESFFKRCCTGGKSLAPEVAGSLGKDVAECTMRMSSSYKAVDWTKVTVDWKKAKQCSNALNRAQCGLNADTALLCFSAISGKQKVGEACKHSWVCTSGSYCDKATGVCEKRKELGGSCKFTDEDACVDGLSCSYTKDECIKAGKAGDTCSSDDPAQCQAPLRCMQGQCMAVPNAAYCR